jgi:hypothetical protein
LHDAQVGSALVLRVTPRARKNAIVGVQTDGTIKIHITAPPVEDKANQALVAFLAEVLGIAKTRIEIVAGASGRDKLVSIVGMSAGDAHQKIVAQLG